MDHLSEIQCSTFVDCSLDKELEDAIERHLQSCAQCKQRIDILREERQLIQDALTSDYVMHTSPIPKFNNPLTLRDFALANVITGLLIWLSHFLWKSLFEEFAVNTFSQLAAAYFPDIYELMVSATLNFIEQGTVMINNYLTLIVSITSVVAVVLLARLFRKSRLGIGVCLLASVALWAQSNPSQALEIRFSDDDDLIVIPASEIIQDTVILVGDDLRIEGEVQGDVIAIGERIVVTGVIQGNLVSFAESIALEGRVGGLTLMAASAIDLQDAVIGGDMWSAAGHTTINDDTSIQGNGVFAGELVSHSGVVGRDFLAFAETVELSGEVVDDMDVISGRLTLVENAQIGGNLRFRSGDENNLQRSPNVSIAGEVEFIQRTQDFNPRPRFMRGNYYLWQVVYLVGGFLVGLLFFWMSPPLRNSRLESGFAALKTAGFGLLGLLGTPVLLALLAITLIGLPFSVIGFFLWITAIYLAKIVLARQVGQLVLSTAGKEEKLWLALLIGLVIIIVLTRMPVIGGVLNFILIVLGIGLLAQLVIAYLAGVRTNKFVEHSA